MWRRALVSNEPCIIRAVTAGAPSCQPGISFRGTFRCVTRANNVLPIVVRFFVRRARCDVIVIARFRRRSAVLAADPGPDRGYARDRPVRGRFNNFKNLIDNDGFNDRTAEESAVRF